MNWINKIFFIILLTSLTGTFCGWFWNGIKKVLIKKESKIIFFCLKIVLVSYFVPILYWTLLLMTGRAGDIWKPTEGNAFLYSPASLLIVGTADVIWFLMMLIHLIRKSRSGRRWHGYFKGNVPEENEKVLAKFKEVCDKLQVSDKVRLMRNDMVHIPMVTGILRPTVILPFEDFTESEVEMILYHEVMHYVRKDIWLKRAAMCMSALHWFNPFAQKTQREITVWSEINCDIAICFERAVVHPAKYGTMLLQRGGLWGDGDNSPGMPLADDEGTVERRIEQMTIFKKKGKLGIGWTLLAMLGLLFGTSITSLASGAGVMAANDTVYGFTKVEVDETENLMYCGERLVEYVVLPDDPEYNLILNEGEVFQLNDVERGLNMLKESAVVSAADPSATTYFFEWSVWKNDSVNSPYFHALIDTTIAVHGTSTSPSAAEAFRIGIIEPTGVMRYVMCPRSVAYDFTVRMTGQYMVYVQNVNDYSINVSGLYVFWK